jgi:broad specificity phosphatase PhoE
VIGEEPYQIWLPPAEDHRLLVVAHGGSIAVSLAHLLGIPAVPWEAERFSVGWAGISRLRTRRVAAGAVWSLMTFNQRVHLAGLADPDEGPTEADSVAKPGS